MSKGKRLVNKGNVKPLSTVDVLKLKKQITEETTERLMTVLLAIPVLVGEKYGWSDKELEDFANDIVDEYANFENSSMTLAELKEYTYNKVGIKFCTKDEVENAQNNL